MVQAQDEIVACPYCRAELNDGARLAVKCPKCSRWLRLPHNPYLVALSEMPALGSDVEDQSPFPWRELSPSLGLVMAFVAMGAGVAIPVLVMMFIGAASFLGCIAIAAVLEFAADRKAEKRGENAASMSMLSQSSDWPTVRRGGPRRGQG
jgi:hypothetical protein